MLQLLLDNCDGEEECRNVVAECLGRLALLHPEPVLKALLQRVSAPSANVRSVVSEAEWVGVWLALLALRACSGSAAAACVCALSKRLRSGE